MTATRTLLMLLLSGALSFRANAQKVFAKATAEGFEFVQDTTAYKQYVLEHLFSGNINPPDFNRVEIWHQLTMGEKTIPFYYVLLQDRSRTIKVAKWLERKGDELIISNDSEKEFLIYGYLICAGDKDCSPQVFIADNKTGWSCSTSLQCTKEPDPKCRSSKSIIVED